MVLSSISEPSESLSYYDANSSKARNAPTDKNKFTQECFEERLLIFITALRLPFQLIGCQEFKALVQIIQLAPVVPELPSAKTIRPRLQSTDKERQQTLLQKLPPEAELSIALDCWTAPFQQAFMVVTGYFIDQDWNYCEILLGFEPLHGPHSGVNLSTVLLRLLQQHQIADRVLAITRQ